MPSGPGFFDFVPFELFVTFVVTVHLRGSWLSSNERAYMHVGAVRLEGDLTVEIGSVDRRADGFESLKDIGRRMTEGVAPAAADDRNVRPPDSRAARVRTTFGCRGGRL